jgi:hypothetical protein
VIQTPLCAGSGPSGTVGLRSVLLKENRQTRHPATALNRAGGRMALGISPALSRQNNLVLLLFCLGWQF